jgi:3-carboxy-cis,cis-muconate cycloisomerase
MPHKQNPVGSTLAIACARQVIGATVVLLGAMPQEHERAAGAWHAEWPASKNALAFAGGAVSALSDVLTGLRVDTERMRANLALLGDAVMAERLSLALSDRLGRRDAHDLVSRANSSSANLRDAVLADKRNELTAAELDELLDPTRYLGSADRFVDRALSLYAEISP